MSERTRMRLTIAVIALGAVLRLAVLIAFPQIFAFEETGIIHGSDAYDRYARNLLATGVYGLTPGRPDATIPPLYSYVVAALYGLFGRTHWATALFNITLDMFSMWAVIEIGRRLLNPTVGLMGGLFYALYPYLIFQNLPLIDTPLFMAFMHAFLLTMVHLRERRDWRLSVIGGLLLGLGMLVRPILPPLAVLIGIWFLFRLDFWETLRRLAPVALIGVLVLVPWVARNYVIFGRFVPMTTTSGSNFWQGNSPYTIEYFRAGYDVQWTAPRLPPGLDEVEADKERFRLAFEYLRQNPQVIPELLWVKFLVHWSIDVAPRYNPTERLAPDDPIQAYDTPLFEVIGRTVHRFYFGALLFLAVIGFVLSWRMWRDASLLWFVQLAMTMVYVAFHPSTRYRCPSDPLLFLLSGYTLWYAWERWGRDLLTRRPSNAPT